MGSTTFLALAMARDAGVAVQVITRTGDSHAGYVQGLTSEMVALRAPSRPGFKLERPSIVRLDEILSVSERPACAPKAA